MLKQKQDKETAKQKAKRRADNLKIQSQLKTIVLPIVGVVVLAILIFVIMYSQPSEEDLLMMEAIKNDPQYNFNNTDVNPNATTVDDEVTIESE